MAVHVCGKGVAGLVRHNLNIVLGAVKVGKDKRNLIIGDAGAVATAAFAFGGENIQQFIVQHHAEEFAGLGRKLIIELATHEQGSHPVCRWAWDCRSGIPARYRQSS